MRINRDVIKDGKVVLCYPGPQYHPRSCKCDDCKTFYADCTFGEYRHLQEYGYWPESKIKKDKAKMATHFHVNQEHLAQRCEVCHQSDQWDGKVCGRCAGINPSKSKPPVINRPIVEIPEGYSIPEYLSGYSLGMLQVKDDADLQIESKGEDRELKVATLLILVLILAGFILKAITQ